MKIFMFLSMIFIWGSHPLMMMGGLMILILLLFLYFYMSGLNFWLGYLLVLVMMSGILVIFSYMLSLIPNLNFEQLTIFIPLMFLFMILEVNLDMNFFDYSLVMKMIWVKEMNYLTLYMVNLLLLLMMVVLFISIVKKGSLRVGY